jgi:hypothetical protein
MKRNISALALLFCMCFSVSFPLKGQNYSDPDQEFFLDQLKKQLSEGRLKGRDLLNDRNNLRSGSSINADIGNTPPWSWVRTFGGSGGITVNEMVLDGSENIYILATFSDTIKMANQIFGSRGLRDVLIIKLSSLGSLLWSVQIKSLPDQNIYGKSLALGSGGKIYVSGDLESQTITGGGLSRTKTGDEKIFNAALDNNGNFIWLKIGYEPETVRLLTDSKGDIYRMTPDSLFKLTQAGNIRWAKEIGGYLNDFKIIGDKIWVSGVAPSAGVTIAGVIFTPIYLSCATFLVEMDTTGNYFRRKFFEMDYYDPYYINALIETDLKGNIYLSGTIWSDVYYNGTWISNPSGVYIYKLNKNLDLVWNLSENLSYNIEPYRFVKNGDNRFYQYGYYYLGTRIDSITMGNITVFPEDAYGYYLSEFDSNGTVLQIKTYPDLDRNFVIKGTGTFYRINNLSYDLSIEKTTLDGAQYWLREIENTGGYAGLMYTMDIDDDGNLYAQGYCSGKVRVLGSVTDVNGIMFMKFDNDGNMKWLRVMENPEGASSGIRVDKAGNVYAWGYFNSFIKIGGQEYYSTEGSNIYFIRFDSDGDLKFVKQFNCSQTVIGAGGIDVDPNGDIFLCGAFIDTLHFAGYELKSYDSGYDGFLVKLNSNGLVLWARRYGGKSSDWVRSVASDSIGNIYITGYYRDSIAFDSIHYLKKSIGGYDMFLAKMDPKGNVVWAEGGSPDNKYVRGHAVTVAGDKVYVQGLAYNTVTYKFGDISLASEFNYNSFLAKYNAEDGDIQWVKLTKATKYNWPMYKIDTDPESDVYIGGIFYDTLVVESNILPGSGGTDYYIAKYNNNGELQWLKSSEQSNTGDIELFSLAVFEKDVVLVGGRLTNGTVQVGDQRLITASTQTFAGLIGEAIIGCEIKLDISVINSQPGDSTGSAQLTIIGGTPPYHIGWSNGQEDIDQIKEQPAGIYQVTVEDAKECIQYKEFAINYLNGPVVTIDSIYNVSCFGYADGKIDISVTGGTSPYQYYWSNGMKTEDIENLEAAPYEVQVKDAKGLIVYQGFVVSEPKQLDVTYDVIPASCNGGVNGRIDLFVSGGTKPYKYEWSNEWTTDYLSGIPAGKYKIIITDNNACVRIEDIALSEVGSSIVETDSIIPATCNVDDGQVTVKVLGNDGPYTFLWSNGATTPYLVSAEAKNYFVNITNKNGCKTVHKVTVGSKLPAENPICLVTVDTAIGSNLVVWEKIANTEMYHVFRETSEKDIYLLAGSLQGGALSVFTDSVANPMVRGYRYKIAALDECGNASILSTLHKTVHLRISPGQFSNIMNLDWDDYVGNNVESFEVWRYSSVFGWELLETLPGDLFSYTDLNVPPGKVFYNVRVPFPNMCYPSGYNKAGTGPYSHSMSNIEDNRFQTGNVEISVNPGIYIYPNPTTGKCYIWSESVRIENPEIQVMDLQGRIVRIEKPADNSDGKISIDLSGQSEGSYIVKVRSGEYIMYSKLIIQ